MSIINSQPLIGASGNQGGAYNLTRSLRFRSSAGNYLNRTPASAGNRQKWTYSVWAKRGTLGVSNMLFTVSAAQNDNDRFLLLFNSSDQISIDAWTVNFRITSQVFRDPSAWYHIVLSVDTTQATANDRIKLYVNGSQITAFGTTNNPTQNANVGINAATLHNINKSVDFGANYFDGYQTEINFIDGQALTPSSFGENNATTGVWQPIRYTGTYGTNGFYLPFTDVATTSGSNAGLGKDFSGNGNYWTTNNISVTAGTTYDSMTDVPTLTSATAANYAVLNPLNTQSNLTVSSANLQCVGSTANWRSSVGTMGSTSGKYYWETTLTSGSQLMVGFVKSSFSGTTDNQYVGQTSDSYAYYTDTGGVYNTGSSTAYGATCAIGDIIGVALDLDNGKAYFSKNGTWQNSGNPATQTNPAFTSLSGTFLPGLGMYSTTGAVINFGQRPFAYTPPTGYKALNTYNLPDSTIVAGNRVMDATTYTGNGSTQTITNAAGFQPDFVWCKSRSNGSHSHLLLDSVRGNDKPLRSNTTGAESSWDSGAFAITSTGFSTTGVIGLNSNTDAYVGWQWQAGQGTTSSNTDGSITSTVSVNTTAGFSIVTYTGTGSAATVGHGLGVAPKMIIFKDRNNGAGAQSWMVYHASTGNQAYLLLNLTNAVATGSGVWNNTSPTSSVFSLGSPNNNCNASGDNYVAYCWSEIPGFSKFGSYVGNGSTDGAFIYTGFRPKYVLIKRTDGGNDWVVLDTSRSPYNVADKILYPNYSLAEETFTSEDILSNGFKLRTTGANFNASGGTYIYMAFAENPQKLALAR